MTKRNAALFAVLIVVCLTPAFAQNAEPEPKDKEATPESVVRIPAKERAAKEETVSATSSLARRARTEEVLDQPDYDVWVRGEWPQIMMSPTGVPAELPYLWQSAFIGLGVDDSWTTHGNFFYFQLNDGGGTPKQFLFNRNVVLKDSRLGVGATSLPAYDIDVNKNVVGPVSAMIRNTSTDSSSSAAVEIKTGNGTTSSRRAYTRYTSSESTLTSWTAGMVGSTDYTVRDTTDTPRMTISTAGATPTVTFNAVVSGTKILANFQDVAEWVPATQQMDSGTVVILNPAHDNQVMPSNVAYDTTVAGVVSAEPGVLLGHPGRAKVRVATTGRVLVNVDASRLPIRIGDLLVTGIAPGTAVRSEPIDLGGGVRIHRPGTIIGKALQPLPSGTGQILVLLSLQ